MTEETAQPFSPDPPESPDRANPDFDFDSTEWHEEPTIVDGSDDDTMSVTDPRNQSLTNYRSIASIIDWNRYIHLGFFAYEDGQEFAKVWNNDKTTWLIRHQIIWFNYKYHLDHSMETSVLLHNWATKLSQQYILHHHADFLSDRKSVV